MKTYRFDRSGQTAGGIRLHATALSQRRGVAMMLAIVTLALVTVLGAASVRGVLETHRQLQREEARAQADWLAESGIARARAQLRADSKYTGEEWQPKLPEWGDQTARVTIELTAASGEMQPVVTVTVEFPGESSRRVKVTRKGPGSVTPDS